MSPLQVDGEPIGATHVSISLDAASLSLPCAVSGPGGLYLQTAERVFLTPAMFDLHVIPVHSPEPALL